MCDQDICIIGDLLPLLFERFTSWEVERPVEKLRLPRTTVDLDAFDYDGTISQVRAIRQHRFCELGFVFEGEVVITGNDNFVFMGECPQKVVESSDLFLLSARGKVSRVDQDVSVGDVKLVVFGMSITDGYNSHGICL